MRLKHRYVVLGLLAAVVLLGLGTFKAFPQAGGFRTVTFATQDVGLVFFDHDSGKVYVYDSGNGKIATTWQLTQLGMNLKQIQ